MTKREGFHANGVSLVDSAHDEITALADQIPMTGTLHLAILQPPYLDLIKDGVKTIESRFNKMRAAPYGKVAVGDLVLLKETGKPVTNYFFATSVKLFNLSEVPIEYVRQEYGNEICAQDEENFWTEREMSRYATLIGIGDLGTIEPVTVMKRDQRGWVTFSRRDETLF